jgi:hypothetical protein
MITSLAIEVIVQLKHNKDRRSKTSGLVTCSSQADYRPCKCRLLISFKFIQPPVDTQFVVSSRQTTFSKNVSRTDESRSRQLCQLCLPTTIRRHKSISSHSRQPSPAPTPNRPSSRPRLPSSSRNNHRQSKQIPRHNISHPLPTVPQFHMLLTAEPPINFPFPKCHTLESSNFKHYWRKRKKSLYRQV